MDIDKNEYYESFGGHTRERVEKVSGEKQEAVLPESESTPKEPPNILMTWE